MIYKKVFKMNMLLGFISCLTFGYTFETHNEIPMIVDVIQSFRQPTAVTAKLCWNDHEKFKLSSVLMNTETAKTITFIDKVKELDKFDNIHILVISDLKCPDTDIFLKEANDTEKFRQQTRWLMVPIQKEYGNISTELANLSIIIDSEVMVAYENEDNKVLLSLVYRIDASRPFRLENYGAWSNENGLMKSQDMETSLIIRRKNLHGKPVTMAMVSAYNSTRNDLYALKYPALDNISKATFHQLIPVYEFMNATIDVVYSTTWGYFINNTWNGMIGQINEGKADICGTILFIRAKRFDVVTFMTQSIPTSTKIVFHDPPLSFQNNLYILPFKSTVWISVGAMIPILMAILYINAKWELAKHAEKMNPKDPTILRPNLSDVFIYVISAVTQQGSNSELKGSLGRVVILIMFLIFLFLYTSYSANIVALLQSSSDQIQTLSDLLNSRLELGVENETYNMHYFTTATDPVQKALYEAKVLRSGKKPNFMSLDEGLAKLRNKDTPFAFNMNLGIGYKKVEELFEEHEKCGLREIEFINNASPWTCCKKTSPYKEIYKIGAMRSIEHGISNRLNLIFYVKKPTCTVSGGSFGSVSMVDFHPVLLMLLYGMIMAIVLLALEILAHKKLNRRKYENNL